MERLKPYFLTFKLLPVFLLVITGSFRSGAGLTPTLSVAHSTGTVVINEIMVDPTPLVGLPDAEWIELFNGSSQTVSLKGWTLEVGSSIRNLPDSLLEPGGYLVLCSQKSAPDLRQWARVLELSTLPVLRNSGNRITLFLGDGAVADFVDYADTWYRDHTKKNGGWSLERMDPERSCGQKANWSESNDPLGGTPGRSNSVFAHNPDLEKPEVLRTTTQSQYSVEIEFSETMDTLLLKNPLNYRLPPNGRPPEQTVLSDATTVVLTWKEPFTANIIYQLELLNLADECGNPPAQPAVEIRWITVEPGDVVLNELLFNPWPGGNDFVEILNVSSKNIDAGKLMLAGRDGNNQLKPPVSLKQAGLSLLAGEFLTVTTDTGGIFPYYLTPCRDCIRQITSLPAMNNDRGTLVLLNDSGKVLDEFSYHEEMHHPFLYDREGVSLERVHPALPASAAGNWQSASSESGFATPGYRNSQFCEHPSGQNNITFEQTAFSPDDDGYNDELLIRYSLDKPGWIASCRVFDLNGQPVFQVLNNGMLASEGTLTWNGEDETGSLLPAGPYILLLEMFNTKGHRDSYRKGVVLTRRWE